MRSRSITPAACVALSAIVVLAACTSDPGVEGYIDVVIPMNSSESPPSLVYMFHPTTPIINQDTGRPYRYIHLRITDSTTFVNMEPVRGAAVGLSSGPRHRYVIHGVVAQLERHSELTVSIMAYLGSSAN